MPIIYYIQCIYVIHYLMKCVTDVLCRLPYQLDYQQLLPAKSLF